MRSRAEIISDMVDAGMTDDEIKAAVSSVKSSLQQSPPTSTPMETVEKLAPSNVLKLTGVMGANAPKAANFLLSGMPGLGNPNNIVPDALNLRQGIKQIPAALRRTAQVAGGAPLTPQETLPARLGQAAGTGLEMVAPNLSTEGVKATGPFTAGVKKPATALPGTYAQAGQELGQARTAARALDEASQAARFRRMLSTPNGQSKLAEEGKSLIESGADLSVTQLEAYAQAMGKMQKKLGSFGNDYAKAREMGREMLQWKAPELVDKIENMAVNYAAKGNQKASIPWLGWYIHPSIAAFKTALMPGPMNAMGAVAGQATRLIPKISPVGNQAYQYLMNRAKNGRE